MNEYSLAKVQYNYFKMMNKKYDYAKLQHF